MGMEKKTRNFWMGCGRVFFCFFFVTFPNGSLR